MITQTPDKLWLADSAGHVRARKRLAVLPFLVIPLLAACLHAGGIKGGEFNPVSNFQVREHSEVSGAPVIETDMPGIVVNGYSEKTLAAVLDTGQVPVTGVLRAEVSDTGVPDTVPEMTVETGDRVPPAGDGAVEGTAVVPGTVSPPPQQPPSQGERIMKALAQAYPDRIGPAEFRNGDWAVPIRGTWYYYAEGRLLPEELRSRAAEYDPQPFYNYAAELPPWRTPTAEESERFRSQAQERLEHPVKRSQHFHDALWRATNRNEAWDRVKSLRFLGRPVYVHYSILEELALVEERILDLAKTNAQIQQWINNLDILDGWSWRNIADTESRSFHSYGAALDLLPKSTGNLETYFSSSYWLWASRVRSDWWMIPYSQRFHPPDLVIKAFEDYGFIWGGKWTTYDTMHFEYRPEIFILNNLPMSTLR